MEELNELMKVLRNYLERKGLDQTEVPAFLRDLSEAITTDQDVRKVKSRLILMGWSDFDLDYRTLELVDACLDGDMGTLFPC